MNFSNGVVPLAPAAGCLLCVALPIHAAMVVLLLCAAAVAGGIFLIEELDNPTSGLIRISPEPFRAEKELLAAEIIKPAGELIKCRSPNGRRLAGFGGIPTAVAS